MASDPRFIDLETKLGFLEHTVEELNKVVFQQGRTIELLEARVAKLEGRLAGQGDPDQAPADPLSERPPHY